jgi:hypothetical protein
MVVPEAGRTGGRNGIRRITPAFAKSAIAENSHVKLNARRTPGVAALYSGRKLPPS